MSKKFHINKEQILQKNLWSIILIILSIGFVVGGVIIRQKQTNRILEMNSAQNKLLHEKIEHLTLKMNEKGLDVIAVKNIIMENVKQSIKLKSMDAQMYAEEIVNVANEYKNISPSLLTSLLLQESRFDKDAKSIVGAKGLGQIMPETTAWICSEWNKSCNDQTAFDPIFSIRASAWFLNWIYENSNIVNKKEKLMLAYYNGGGRQAYRYGLYIKEQKGIELNLKEKKYRKRLSSETEHYVKVIIKMDKKFSERIKKQLPTG